MATYNPTTGYGEHEYGGDFYGVGTYNGLDARQVVLYLPNSGTGEINFAKPITHIPTDSETGILPSQTSLADTFLPDFTVNSRVLYRSYHKLWVYNSSDEYILENPVARVDDDSDPNGYIKLALEDVNSTIPRDGDFINVSAGVGPGEFAGNSISFSNPLNPQSGMAFWVRRDVVVLYGNQRSESPGIIIEGNTEVT